MLFWFALMGKEFYCYNKKEDEVHKDMHSLVGAFIKMGKPEQFAQGTIVYPFKIVFPNSQVRIYYSTTEEESKWWYDTIKRAIGYLLIDDFYEFTV